eukprot:GILJ01001916.1.p1 GENE.GILJ01001916.1~~GILJ01001916.1.p1  ORF type:complete len:980 (-),score=200.10 GILJ01001916.1:129-3032(-)
MAAVDVYSAPAPLTSAAGVLSLLQENEDQLKVFALQKLNAVVDQFWAEIADFISEIESLYEDERFPQRELAALVASKVYYHLEEYNDALRLALGAGSLFDVSKKTQYVDTLISKCIDEYIALRVKNVEARPGEDLADIDPRLEAVVERMWERCFQDGEFKQALGIALESRRLDKVEQSIVSASKMEDMLAYCFDIAQTVVTSREFRRQVLQVLVKLYRSRPNPDYINVCQCLFFLDDAAAVAEILTQLIQTPEGALMACQIAFDLDENENQQFTMEVSKRLPEEKTDTGDHPQAAQLQQLRSILAGTVAIELGLEFLYRNNHTDLLVLKNVKNALDSRNSVTHSATVFTHALMHAGTTVDTFLRENLDWLARATNWAKFSATASLGVIHKGHLKQGLTVLNPYLPQHGVNVSPYSEGGALYALGIIHANHNDADTVKYLLNSLHATQNETVQHGACLGLGLAAMATGNEELFEELKNILYSDSAVAGEAAGLAIGLVMCGTASDKAIQEMLAYAHETQHEKIIRGLAMGIALTMYGREEEADTLIEQLSLDKDPILRYGGMYAVAMAYSGTNNNRAIRRLLHVAVSDVSDDVRRAAVIGLGFVLFRTPDQVPRIVSLLAESYNPHVRYGATLAVGISCAGTGLREAVALLEPMTTDPVDFVRQGALLALAMVLMQQTEALEPKVATVRKLYEKVIADKHEDIMAKFGAVIATGILDAGGRNVTIALRSRGGNKKMAPIVGCALFTQFWYWYPLMHFVSLAFVPTAVIGLNKDLKMPKNFDFKSNVKPSLFAYPAPLTPPVAAEKSKVSTAVLSTTAKVKAKAARKEGTDMEVEGDKKKDEKEEKEATDAMEVEKKEEKKKEEPSEETLSNPARVLPAQVKYISFDQQGRYVPVTKGRSSGILVLQDRRPNEPEDLLVPTQPSTAAAATATPAAPAAAVAPAPTAAATSVEQEPEAPEPFEWEGTSRQ